MRADLLARPRLAGAQFDVAGDQLVAACDANGMNDILWSMKIETVCINASKPNG